MELEAKFAIPDQDTFEQFQALIRLGAYQFSDAKVKVIMDEYLDTADRKLLAAGFALRRRTQADGVVMALKGLGGVEGAIHRREELELHLPVAQPPETWPESPTRARLWAIVGDAPLDLQCLFSLKQKRLVRVVAQAGQRVAELSLDRVESTIGETEHHYFELEIEALSSENEPDLAVMAALLQAEWQLQPEGRSKFERGLAILDEVAEG